jgi:hypothetical protein
MYYNNDAPARPLEPQVLAPMPRAFRAPTIAVENEDPQGAGNGGTKATAARMTAASGLRVLHARAVSGAPGAR